MHRIILLRMGRAPGGETHTELIRCRPQVTRRRRGFPRQGDGSSVGPWPHAQWIIPTGMKVRA
jgi:hypothetical protein